MIVDLWPIYQFSGINFRKGNTCLRLPMKMEYLTVVGFPKGHVKTTAAKLAVIDDDNALEHVIMKSFRHAVEGADILV